MAYLQHVTMGEVVLAFITCCLVHEACILLLPDHIAGPGGWLIDTTGREE